MVSVTQELKILKINEQNQNNVTKKLYNQVQDLLNPNTVNPDWNSSNIDMLKAKVFLKTTQVNRNKISSMSMHFCIHRILIQKRQLNKI